MVTVAAAAWGLLGFYLVFLHDEAPAAPSVAEAAERTREYDGFRADTIASFQSKALQMQLNGTGAFNRTTGRSQLTLRSLNAPGGNFVLNWIADGRYVYLSMPQYRGISIKGDKGWLKLDLADFACRGSADPKDQVDQLRSVEPVETTVGPEQVRGVETTHRRATLDLNRQLALLREEGRDDIAQSLQLLVDKGHPAQLEADVWVDDEGLIRREKITIPFAVLGGKNPQMTMQTEYYDFGVQPQIELPPKSAVYDATGDDAGPPGQAPIKAA